MNMFKPLAVAVALLSAGTANAAITIYTSQAAFLAAVMAPGSDAFDNFSNTGTTASPITRTAGSYSYSAAASTNSFFGAGSGVDHWLSTNLATDSIIFSNFSSTVRGVGGLFFGSDINGLFHAGNVNVSATDASGTVNQLLVLPTTTTFVGFVSDLAFTNVTVTAVQPATPLWPTVNNLVLAAAAVPEPATWMLMIAGFGLVGGAMRRKVVATA